MCFLIASFFTFVSGILSDYYGRKSFILVNWAIGIIGYFMCIYSDNFNVIIFGIICFAIFIDGYFSISSIFIGEVMGKRFGGMTISLGFFAFGLGSVTFVLINLFVYKW